MTGAGCGHLQDDGKRRRQRHWCRVLLRGLRTEYGPWNTIAMSRRSCRKSRAELWVMWRSSNSTRPPVGSSRRVISRPVVVCRSRTPRPATMSPRHPEQHRGRIRANHPRTAGHTDVRNLPPVSARIRSPQVDSGARGDGRVDVPSRRVRTHGARCCAPSWPRLPHCQTPPRTSLVPGRPDHPSRSRPPSPRPVRGAGWPPWVVEGLLGDRGPRDDLMWRPVCAWVCARATASRVSARQASFPSARNQPSVISSWPPRRSSRAPPRLTCGTSRRCCRCCRPPPGHRAASSC